MAILRPLPMAKIGIVGLKDDRELLVGLLHDLGVLQLEPIGKEALEHLEAERAPEAQRQVSDQLIRIRGLKTALPGGPVGETRTFHDLPEILEAAAQVPLDDEIGALKREEDQLLTRRTEVVDTLGILQRFGFYQHPYDYLTSKSLLAFFGSASPAAFASVEPQIRALTDASHLTVVPMDREVRFLLALPRDQAEAAGRIAQQHGVKLLPVPALTGTAAEERPRLLQEQARLDARLGEIRQRLSAISALWYPALVHLEEALTIENRKLEAYPRMGASSSSFALEGWIRARDKSALVQRIESATSGRTIVYDVPTTEEPPTVMDNPPGARWYEFFVRFYSIPMATEWDPTLAFAFVFPILFGFMLGDVGYAAVILGICLWMMAGFPGGGGIPRFIRGIPKMVMPGPAMRQLAFALAPGCVVGIAFGVLTNAWFGFQLPYYTALIDPLRSTGQLLLFAGYLGLVMVVFGFVLGALKEYLHHHVRAAGVKVAAIVICFSLAAFGLSLLRGQLGASLIAEVLELSGIIGGAVAVVALAHGPKLGDKLMEAGLTFIEALSHILSFTRLVGILLASVILALVINQIGVGLVHGGFAGSLILGGILGVALVVFGALFNVILGVFEPGIQGMRLMFVEYFSKFYEGNGKPFRSFGSRRTFTGSPHVEPPLQRGTRG